MRPTIALCVALPLLLAACAQPPRMGMVAEQGTGLAYGSVIEKNIVLDSAQLRNKNMKLRIRNTSGDMAFGLAQFRSELEKSYRSQGYTPTDSDDYGLLIDINVVYSGQITTQMTKEFGFLGAAAGGLAGNRISDSRTFGTIAGAVSGATLGAIVGSYVQENTYIVVANATIAIAEQDVGKSQSTITFGDGQRKDSTADTTFKAFRARTTTGISVYAGGRNVTQHEISTGVRQRFARILADVI